MNSPGALIGSRASQEDFLSGIGCLSRRTCYPNRARLGRFGPLRLPLCGSASTEGAVLGAPCLDRGRIPDWSRCQSGERLGEVGSPRVLDGCALTDPEDLGRFGKTRETRSTHQAEAYGDSRRNSAEVCH